MGVAEAEMTKDEAMQRLVDAYYANEPEHGACYRFVVDNEDSDEEPLRLLHVAPYMFDMGDVQAFGFRATEELPYATLVAVVSTAEWDRILAHELALPPGWELQRAQRCLPSASHELAA